jgi:hypothetical protein
LDGLHYWCKACVSLNCKKAYNDNKEKIIARSRNYYQTNKTACLAKSKQYAKDNAEDIQQYKKQWTAENRVASNLKLKIRRQTDPAFKLRCNLRSRIWVALKGKQKCKSTVALVGCSIDELKTRLEKQFQPGMTWENRKEWHIDHIRPCSKFDLLKESEQKACFHYSNLQPLWAIDNMRKGNRVTI